MNRADVSAVPEAPHSAGHMLVFSGWTPHQSHIHQYGEKRIDPWLALMGPGAGRRKEVVKREVGEGRGWREIVGVRGEELGERRDEDENEDEGREMGEGSGEGEGAKGVERKEGAMVGFTISF